MTIASEAALPLVPSEEERQIREAVRGICDGFPEDYARQKYAADEPPTELWDALAEKGYLGVNLPGEWGGVGLQTAKNGCRAPVVPGMGCASS